jgi:CheY-like chemotaxis protein
MQRERKSAEGMMLQTDASPHDWLEGRAPEVIYSALSMMRSAKWYASFRPSEDQIGYLLMLRTVALNYGLPHILYHDRHTILRPPKQASIEDELAGRKPQSQVQRIIEQLGIRSIPALSPQAKGRIERLWQTFQDRLRKEMRLAGEPHILVADDDSDTRDLVQFFLQGAGFRVSITGNPAEVLYLASKELDARYNRHRTVPENSRHRSTHADPVCSGASDRSRHRSGEAGRRPRVRR